MKLVKILYFLTLKRNLNVFEYLGGQLNIRGILKSKKTKQKQIRETI